jgi:hypothetical protein
LLGNWRWKTEEPELYEEAKAERGRTFRRDKGFRQYHIIKLKEYMPERLQTLDEVRRNIDVRLIAEAKKKRMQEFEAELKKGAKIEIIEQ